MPGVGGKDAESSLLMRRTALNGERVRIRGEQIDIWLYDAEDSTAAFERVHVRSYMQDLQ